MTSRRNNEIRILPVFPARLANIRAKVRRRMALLAVHVQIRTSPAMAVLAKLAQQCVVADVYAKPRGGHLPTRILNRRRAFALSQRISPEL
jgi:hypothetical protein